MTNLPVDLSVVDIMQCHHIDQPTTSAQSLLTFRKRLKLHHLFRLSYPGLVL